MIYRAEKTLIEIHNRILDDQGNEFRRHLKETVSKLTDPFREEDGFRAHLGASIIGKECSRSIFYDFHWISPKQFDPRIVRLFNRGHLEEARFQALLKMIGIEFEEPPEGGQWRINDYNDHFGGSLDGIIAHGLPDWPDGRLVAEYKTHGQTSFDNLFLLDSKNPPEDPILHQMPYRGVMAAKWEHYLQMQIYMGKKKLQGALYLAVNKNNDDLYAELVPFDQGTFDRGMEKAKRILWSDGVPPKLNKSPSWHTCKMCSNWSVCHMDGDIQLTCRSCQYSGPILEPQGKCEFNWACAKKGTYLDLATQKQGCDEFVLNSIFA